jgi:hypothetical protein
MGGFENKPLNDMMALSFSLESGCSVIQKIRISSIDTLNSKSEKTYP